jgi:hypothetical protein
MRKTNCCFCGPVRNCASYLEKVIENIQQLGSACFDTYQIVLFYDNSFDTSLTILTKLQKKMTNLYLYVNKEPLYKYRTWNLAKARNFCLHFVKTHYSEDTYFIMMDMDNVNCKDIVHVNTLKKYLEPPLNLLWDALSFHTEPIYYDIWALSIYPYCFSYNHFKDNVFYAKMLQEYVEESLKQLPTNSLLPCISAFNGFSIYRLSKFCNSSYDGKVNLQNVPKEYIESHSLATKSPVIFKHYGHVDGAKEDCEHRFFHMNAILKNKARIMISPEILFENKK